MMLPVAIVGGGPVGLALALLLQQSDVDCEVIDARPAGAVGDDRRVLALSHGTRQTLERLGAWAAIGATPITTIHVSQQGHLGRTLIRAEDAGVPALGYVAEAGRVGAALAQACAVAGVKTRHETKVTGTEAGAHSVLLHCVGQAGASDLDAQLVAWAEGAVAAESAGVRRDYGQQAIVAGVQTREPQSGTAYERFTPTGPVALLPLADRHALVWTVPDAAAADLLALDDSAFLSRLQDVFSGRLDFVALAARTAFPLGLRYRAAPVAERAVWVGNAAQTLHPVAGQGFNLALRDVSQLARVLRDSRTDCGHAALLARHAAARRLDRQSTIGFTDGLVRLFGIEMAAAGHARGAGLLALDLLPGARRFLARRMIFGARGW
jgi:2-octaprenyl-6-methoxyphenol hydroxylase